MRASFQFDDYSLLSGPLWFPFPTRPLTYLTFWINRAVDGNHPAAWHAVNLALHLCAVALLRAALATRLPARAAYIAAAIFAAHPFAGETVNYIFARASVLAIVLCLAALAAWTRERRWHAVAWFAAALLAKEECVAFPALLLLLHRSNWRRPQIWRPVAAMFALSFAAGLRVLLAAQSNPGSQAGLHAGVAWSAYLLAQGAVILRYLRLFVLPWGFTVDPPATIPPLWAGLLAWAVVIALLAAAVSQIESRPAALWFIAGIALLLPSSSVFPAADLAADRRMYLPLIAFAACAGLLLNRLPPAVPLAVVAALALLSMERTIVWQSGESLWSDALAKAPGKLRPRLQLARAVEPARGLELLEAAKSIAPADPRIASEEGRIYLMTGQPERALVEFGRALALSPNDPRALNNRGAALLAMGQAAAARQDFERALSRDPCLFDALWNLRKTGPAAPPPAHCRFDNQQSRALAGN